MKLCPSHSQKMLRRESILIAVLMFLLAGCSGGNSNETVLPEQTEIDQLKDENEKLRKDLETAIEALNEAAAKSEELETEKAKTEEEKESEIVPESQPQPQPPATTQIEFAPPQRTPEELLVGEWFFLDFHEEGIFSWMQSMVFYSDGTGTLNRTYYVPKAEAEDLPYSLENWDISAGYSWSLNGDKLHVVADSGENIDFILLLEQQQLLLDNGDDVPEYGREKPSILDGYVERRLFAESNVVQAKKEFVTRSFLGTWYFDVLTWTFNEDGTGVIDIPKLGDQPATTRNFSYSLTVDMDGTEVTYMCLMLDWPDGKTAYFYPTIDVDGSITLAGIDGSDAIKLTRTFDLDNCPMSTAIIANGLSVISGSIFSDILPS